MTSFFIVDVIPIMTISEAKRHVITTVDYCWLNLVHITSKRGFRRDLLLAPEVVSFQQSISCKIHKVYHTVYYLSLQDSKYSNF